MERFARVFYIQQKEGKRELDSRETEREKEGETETERETERESERGRTLDRTKVASVPSPTVRR